MKKIFTLAFSAMFLLGASNVFAQDEEDVTRYISNAGFDEDLTFGLDGSWKEMVSTSSLSDRSEAWIAADSSIYAHTKTTSSQSRPDGRKAEAVNGFIGRINGWTIETNQTFPKCEWVYFGSIPYGLSDTAIPIADDGSTYLVPPAKPDADNGEDNKGFVYLRAGWGGSCVYKQVVKLPCAQYRLDYWVYNTNYEASKNNTGVKNLCKVTCRKDQFLDEDGFNAQEWTLHSIEFTPTSEFSIQFGFQSSGVSGSNPFICIDGIKLYMIGEADKVELLQADLGDFLQELKDTAEICLTYDGLIEEVNDFILEAEETLDSDDEAELEAAIESVKAYIARMGELQELSAKYEALILEVEELLESEDPYPGIDDLNDAYSEISEEAESAYADAFASLVDRLEKAIWDYRFSQPASPENPADYSFYIDNPTFAAQGKWYIGQSGGDQRVKSDFTDENGESFTGWNAWRNNLSSPEQSVSISQDLTGLPNGFYTVTAAMCTQDGCITDQHVYATSAVQTANSAVMTQTGWNPFVFEPLTTEVVLVVDGTLTIGAIGHGADTTPDQNGGTLTDYRCGWFCVTDFKLNYLGEASEEEIAAAIAAKFTAAEEYAAAMHLAADKATAVAAVAAAKADNDLSALKEALKEAEASETEYSSVINGTYKSLQDSVAKYPAAISSQVTSVVLAMTDAYLTSEEATYKNTGSYTEILRYYLNTLNPVLDNAEATKFDSEEANEAVANVLNSVANELKALKEMPTTAYLAEKIAAINEIMDKAAMADIAYGDNTDVTGYIVNAAITDANVTGWTVNKIVGDGSGAKSGQAKNGDANDYYIDTYNSTPGNVRANYFQILNVPNGVYEFSADQRNSGGGFYLFASTGEPVKNADDAWTLDAEATNVLALAKVQPLSVATYVDASVPDDSMAIFTDTYGEYWKAAADKYIELTGAAATEETSLFDIISDYTSGDAIEGYEAEWAILSANSGKGRGWFNNKLQIEVADHKLTVGVSNDSVFTAGLTDTDGNPTIPFTGAWFSANDFKLVMISEGDNEGWSVFDKKVTVKDITDLIDRYLDGEAGISVADITALIDKFLNQ
ncbi:MAG: hypothetical protein IJT97_03055 [Bacteroidaceae bacterium]|nr:hypothetical protein [Bacteroidaceae bacterium]